MSQYHPLHNGINPEFTPISKKDKDIAYYLKGLSHGNRFVLSEIITLTESTEETKRNLASNILASIESNFPLTYRIGITGSPGVGKSTFIESFGLYLIEKGYKVAVLAIDPSSQVNKGSILGDKTRMQELSSHPNAYVRPTPSGSILGGTATYSKDCINLCEAAGFDIIIVETVGVGQSEIEVDYITDLTILLLQPGAGDELQGIKRGVVESADIFVINKADSTQLELARQTQISYKNAIQLFHHEILEWNCPVLLTSAIQKTGLDAVVQSVLNFKKLLIKLNLFQSKRQQQELKWFEKQFESRLKNIIFKNLNLKERFEVLSQMILTNKISTSKAIGEIDNILCEVIKS